MQGESFAFVQKGEGLGQLFSGRCFRAISQHIAYAVAGEHEGHSLDGCGLEGGVYARNSMLTVELFGEPVRYIAEVSEPGLWIGEVPILGLSPLGAVCDASCPVEAFDCFLA